MTGISHLIIRNSDIICGRGKGFDTCAGNQVFRDVIKEYSSTYVGYGNNRAAKSKTIRKIFDDIVIDKNMRFVARVRKQGWVLLKPRDIKLKIGHALRDIDSVRQKQAKRRMELKRAKKDTLSVVPFELPIEPNQVRALQHTIKHESRCAPPQISFAPNQSMVEAWSRQNEERSVPHRDVSGRVATLHSRTDAKINSYCCNYQGSTVYEQHHVKQDETVDKSSDELTLYDDLKNSIPLDDAWCLTIPLVPDVDPVPDECISSSFNPPSTPDIESLPLSYDIPLGKEDTYPFSALSTSSLDVDSDASSFNFDVALSAIFLELAEGGDLDEKAALVDDHAQPIWMF